MKAAGYRLYSRGARDHAPGRRQLPGRPRARGAHRRRRGRRRVDRGRGRAPSRPCGPSTCPTGPSASPSSRRRTTRSSSARRRAYDIDASLVSALIRAESNYEPRAVSRKGARGLMQLMPATARRLSVPQALRPRLERARRRAVPARARRPLRAAPGPRARGVQRGRGRGGDLRRRAALPGDGRLREPDPPVVSAAESTVARAEAPAAAPPEPRTRGSRRAARATDSLGRGDRLDEDRVAFDAPLDPHAPGGVFRRRVLVVELVELRRGRRRRSRRSRPSRRTSACTPGRPGPSRPSRSSAHGMGRTPRR